MRIVVHKLVCMSEASEAIVSSGDVREPQPHDILSQSQGKCRCGCVPNILSLFEMAELRAKHRKAKQEAAAAAAAASSAEEETKAP